MADRGLLTELELNWSVQQASPLVVDQVVSQTHDDERYIIVARPGHTFKAHTLFNESFSHLAKVVVPETKLVDALDDLLLSVTSVNSVRRQNQQVILLLNVLSVSFRL